MKNIIRILALLVFLALFAIILFKCNNPFKKKIQEHRIEKAKEQNTKKVGDIKNEIEDKSTSIKNGISTKTAISGNNNQLNIFLKKKLDSVCNELNIIRQQLKSVQNEKLEAGGGIVSVVNSIGSGLYEIPFQDCFISGYSEVNTNSLTQDLKYVANVNLHEVTYYRANHQLFRQSFLRPIFSWIKWGGISLKVSTWTDCPNVIIDSIEDIQVIETK